MSKNSPSDLLLERFVQGDLPKAQLDDLAKRIAADPEVQLRVDAIRKSNAEILAHYPAPRVAAAVLSRYQTSRRQPWPVLVFGVALATALVVLVVRPPHQDPGCYVQDGETLCLKGETRLLLYAKVSGGQVRPLVDGSVVHRGDVLQIRYLAGAQAFGAIVSIDGAGTVTQHFPDGYAAAKMATGEAITLNHAYELDDAPAFERFYLVTSMHPFDVSAVLEAARTQGDKAGESPHLNLPNHFGQTTVLLRKAVP